MGPHPAPSMVLRVIPASTMAQSSCFLGEAMAWKMSKVPSLADSGQWERQMVLVWVRATMPTVLLCRLRELRFPCSTSYQALPWDRAVQAGLLERVQLIEAGW